MPVTRDAFLAAFPEFANAAKYSVATIDFWLGQATDALDEARFGKQYPLAVMLYTAHNVVLASQGASGKTTAGVLTSASVGPVSKSYNSTLTAMAGAGPWNATLYGQRYWQMIRAFASGPIYRPSADAAARDAFATRPYR